MVVIEILAQNLESRCGEISLQGGSFGADPESTWVIQNRIVHCKRTSFGLKYLLKITWPIMMAVCVFSAQPLNEITVCEVKMEESTGIKLGFS